VDDETFYANRHPRERIDRYLTWERSLLDEVVPFAKHVVRLGTRLARPAAASARITRSRWRCGIRTSFTSCIAMGGAFDVTRFLSGYYDGDAYLLCPPHFLPNLNDEWFLERIRRNKWVLVTGEADICRAATEQAAALLGARSIPHSLHVWGHGSHHDWPEWLKMAGAYIP
jgi:esterase/lipase superfamily enzyme